MRACATSSTTEPEIAGALSLLRGAGQLALAVPLLRVGQGVCIQMAQPARPREAQALLVNAGHDAHTVHEERLAGQPTLTLGRLRVLPYYAERNIMAP
jgi:hypothetical protein